VREQWRDRQAASPERPNLLVLLVDTLRADVLGCYRAAPSPSPVLDALAARGLVFDEAVAQASWTLPSVASIFTGLLPQSHGVVGDSRQWGDVQPDPARDDPAFLADELVTLAEQAQRAGITTVGVASNPVVSRGTNLAQGFETFLELSGARTGTRWARAEDVNGRFVAWLRRNRDLRFLAYLHYMDVHDPYEPPDGFRPPAPPGLRPALAAGKVGTFAAAINWRGAPRLADPEIAHLRALYAGGVRYWDAQLERLLAALAEAGVLERTIVVVTADHGEAFQEHGKLKHGIHLYEELIRVPLVVAGPGIAPGRAAVQAQGIDLLPTLAARLAVPAPPGLPGQDLLAAPEARPAVSSTRWGARPDGTSGDLVAVRAGGWKLIEAPGTAHAEVYDLRRDPRERENLAAAGGERERLAALLAGVAATAAPPPRVAHGRDPRLEDKLRALGYVE
jgi:arylsulfatase A-like enzyme